ncbi:g10626 [Coccomyxa elongata]
MRVRVFETVDLNSEPSASLGHVRDVDLGQQGSSPEQVLQVLSSQFPGLRLFAFNNQDQELPGWEEVTVANAANLPAFLAHRKQLKAVRAGALATRPAKSYYNKAVPAPSSITTESWPAAPLLRHIRFGTFMDIFHGRDPHCNPGRREFGFLKTLSQAMCDIFDREHAHQAKVHSLLSSFMGTQLFDNQESSIDWFPDCANKQPDGAVLDQDPFASYAALLSEVKSEFGKTRYPPDLQGNVYHFKF